MRVVAGAKGHLWSTRAVRLLADGDRATTTPESSHLGGATTTTTTDDDDAPRPLFFAQAVGADQAFGREERGRRAD